MPGHSSEGYALLRAHSDDDTPGSGYSPNTAFSEDVYSMGMPLTPLTPLTPSGLEFDESERRWRKPSGISPISSWTYFSFWLTVFCTLASLLPPSFSLFPTYEKPHLPSYIHSEPTSRAHRLALTASLYRPNRYIGLEQLNSTIQRAVLPEKLDVFPHVFQSVSKNPEKIGKVWSTNGRARVTFNGLVSPEESKVIINKDVSMIAQIRVADYNLDNCTLALTLPPDPSSNATLASQNRTLNILPSSGRIALDIWALETSATEIDLTTLSGRTRPRRVEKLGIIFGEFEEEKRLVRSDGSETFECGGTGTLRTFEAACAEEGDEECALEFWQEQPETVPRMAITIVQLPSI